MPALFPTGRGLSSPPLPRSVAVSSSNLHTPTPRRPSTPALSTPSLDHCSSQALHWPACPLSPHARYCDHNPGLDAAPNRVDRETLEIAPREEASEFGAKSAQGLGGARGTRLPARPPTPVQVPPAGVRPRLSGVPPSHRAAPAASALRNSLEEVDLTCFKLIIYYSLSSSEFGERFVF